MTVEDQIINLLLEEDAILYFKEIMVSLDLSSETAKNALSKLESDGIVKKKKSGFKPGYTLV